jgi:hypothetical protein
MVSSIHGKHPLISFPSTHHTQVYTDGVIRNSMKNTFTSWKKPGNAGRVHAKRLTRRRTDLRHPYAPFVESRSAYAP